MFFGGLVGLFNRVVEQKSKQQSLSAGDKLWMATFAVDEHERAYSYLKASNLYYPSEVDDLTNYDFHLCLVWLWGFLLNENLFCHFAQEKIYVVPICVVYFWAFTYRHHPTTINL